MGKAKEGIEHKIKKLAEEYQNKLGYSEQKALEQAKIYYDPIQRQEESIKIVRHSLFWCMNSEERQHYEEKEIAEDLEKSIKNEQLNQKKSLRTRLNNWMYEDHPIFYIGVLIFAILNFIFAMVVLILKVLLLK